MPLSENQIEIRNSIQDEFGFVESETTCTKCGKLLTRDNATWGMGGWWHTMVVDCKEGE